MQSRSIHVAAVVLMLINVPMIVRNWSALLEQLSAARPALIQITLALVAAAVVAGLAVLVRNSFSRSAE